MTLIHVRPVAGRWQVRTDDGHLDELYPTKQLAVQAAHELPGRSWPSEVVVEDEHGVVESRQSYLDVSSIRTS